MKKGLAVSTLFKILLGVFVLGIMFILIAAKSGGFKKDTAMQKYAFKMSLTKKDVPMDVAIQRCIDDGTDPAVCRDAAQRAYADKNGGFA